MLGKTRAVVIKTALITLFAVSFFVMASAGPAAAVQKTALDVMKLESLKDGRSVMLGTLMKGKPFYIVMSTST